LSRINIHISGLRLITYFYAINLTLLVGFFKVLKGVKRDLGTFKEEYLKNCVFLFTGRKLFSMLKNIVFFILFFWGLWAHSQSIILSENFENTNDGYLPDGWTKIQENGSDGWVTGNNLASNYFQVPPHSKYAATNDDECNCNSSRNMLITPVIDLTGYTAVVLRFDRYFTRRYGDDVSVEVSTDGGATWGVLKNLQPDEDWKTEYVDLSPYGGISNVLVAFCYTDNGYWASGCAVDNVEIFQPSTASYRFFTHRFYPFVCAGDSFYIRFSLVNLSISEVTGFDVDYYLEGMSLISKSYGSMNLSLLDTFDFEESFYLQNPGIYHFMAVVTAVNGTSPVTCDTVDFTVYAMSHCGHANVLLEENTATWCGFCPEGDFYLDSLSHVYYGRVFPVSVHYGDVLSFDDGNKLINSYFYTYPTLMINRWKFDTEPYIFVSNRYGWFTRVEEQLAQVAPFRINLTGEYDAGNRIYSLHADYIANGELTGKFSVNLYVVESDIDASGYPALYQVNAYNNIPSSHFYMEGDTLTDYHHRYVLRFLSGGIWGYSGIIPDTMHYGDTASADFVVIVPSDWNENRLLVYAVVEFTGENSVYDRNIVAISGTPVVSGSVWRYYDEQVKVYPNPVNDKLHIVWSGRIKSAFAYGIDGKTYGLNIKNSVVDVSDLGSGFYLLVATTESGKVLRCKFVKK